MTARILALVALSCAVASSSLVLASQASKPIWTFWTELEPRGYQPLNAGATEGWFVKDGQAIRWTVRTLESEPPTLRHYLFAKPFSRSGLPPLGTLGKWLAANRLHLGLEARADGSIELARSIPIDERGLEPALPAVEEFTGAVAAFAARFHALPTSASDWTKPTLADPKTTLARLTEQDLRCLLHTLHWGEPHPRWNGNARWDFDANVNGCALRICGNDLVDKPISLETTIQVAAAPSSIGRVRSVETALGASVVSVTADQPGANLYPWSFIVVSRPIAIRNGDTVEDVRHRIEGFARDQQSLERRLAPPAPRPGSRLERVTDADLRTIASRWGWAVMGPSDLGGTLVSIGGQKVSIAGLGSEIRCVASIDPAVIEELLRSLTGVESIETPYPTPNSMSSPGFPVRFRFIRTIDLRPRPTFSEVRARIESFAAGLSRLGSATARTPSGGHPR